MSARLGISIGRAIYRYMYSLCLAHSPVYNYFRALILFALAKLHAAYLG